jgi:hypothetical protein
MSEQQTTPPVDLVVVIDTSVSMGDEARALSEAAQAAIEAARSSCPSDLRVVWLGIEGTWKGTVFNRTVRDYLVQEAKVPEAELHSRKRGTVADGGAQEDAARTIEDISTCFDWRPGAARAIFYLGDEALEGGGDKTEQKDIDAANKAIAIARQANVTIHTYMGTSKSKFKDTIQKEYARVARETGGQTFTDQDAISGFTSVLERVICGSGPTERSERRMPASNPVEGSPVTTATMTDDPSKATIFVNNGTIFICCAMANEKASEIAGQRSTLNNGVKLLGEVFITPGTSLILEGQVGAGLLHTALGVAATAFLGPIGPLARILIAANSYTQSISDRDGK